MSTQILHAPLDATYHWSRFHLYPRDRGTNFFPYEIDELAALRFSIILTAKMGSLEI